MFSRLFGVNISAAEDVFYVHPENREIWQIANDLRGDFTPATAISYISKITPPELFRATYQDFMMFGDAAKGAVKK